MFNRQPNKKLYNSFFLIALTSIIFFTAQTVQAGSIEVTTYNPHNSYDVRVSFNVEVTNDKGQLVLRPHSCERSIDFPIDSSAHLCDIDLPFDNDSYTVKFKMDYSLIKPVEGKKTTGTCVHKIKFNAADKMEYHLGINNIFGRFEC